MPQIFMIIPNYRKKFHRNLIADQKYFTLLFYSRGLEISPSNLNGWMSLATSYTNESYQAYACDALKVCSSYIISMSILFLSVNF